jgi:hypothetical protein
MTSDLVTPADTADLFAIARALYPHDGLADGPYVRVVEAIATQAAHEPKLWHVLHDGLAELREAAGSPLSEATGDVLRTLLGARTAGDFFRAIRSLVAWHLYDDHEVWDFIGYPGSSFEKGGYLHRGFDDLTWLPEPRIEESAETLVPTGELPYPLGARQ